MKNLLFFLWMLLAPIVEDMAEYIIFKTRGYIDPDKSESFAYLIFYLAIGYLLYQK